jgi:hypothetical protein
MRFSKKYITLIKRSLIVLLLLSSGIFEQNSQCLKGPDSPSRPENPIDESGASQNGQMGGGAGGCGFSWTVSVFGSRDPNDITGPDGFGDEKSGSVFYRIHIG